MISATAKKEFIRLCLLQAFLLCCQEFMNVWNVFLFSQSHSLSKLSPFHGIYSHCYSPHYCNQWKLGMGKSEKCTMHNHIHAKCQRANTRRFFVIRIDETSIPKAYKYPPTNRNLHTSYLQRASATLKNKNRKRLSEKHYFVQLHNTYAILSVIPHLSVQQRCTT